MTTPADIGVAALQEVLKTAPNAPGCYQMIDRHGRILYIGKAKNLRNRLTSYTQLQALNNRILSMVNQIARVEVVFSKNEAEAFLMEANLIKQHQPRYNVLLKDDKSFPYLRIDTSHPFPRIEKYRGAQHQPGEYFGPFANVFALNATMALLQKIFLLRPCADSIFNNRSRPCLQYQIKRCTAPCVGYVNETEYRVQIDNARDFLNGKHRDVQVALAREMSLASTAQEYEKAGLYRDRIRALTTVQQEQGLRIAGLDDADVIALARRGDKSVVTVCFYRNGSPFGAQSFHPRHMLETSDHEILLGFIGQFYQSHVVPRELLLGSASECLKEAEAELQMLSEALSTRSGSPVVLRMPQRGDKRQLVIQALNTAKAALERLEMERAHTTQHLLALKERLQMPSVPQRIEVYDNSHISGTHAIGACIVATPEGFDKKSYRTYSIKEEGIAGDDYAMMREVIRRRFKPTSEAESEARILPDLLLIDGGIGQLHAVEETLRHLNVVGPTIVAIAKGQDRNAGREWFHQPGREPFQLPVGDPLLHYLQRLRDEAHRFAIGRHRNTRSKRLTQSALDDIPGIGPTRKRALLQHFGSRADVETATLEELGKVTGISGAMARRIYDYFHG
jgi:excinuclease ABC subunit C